MKKRTLAILLTLVMAMSILPVGSFMASANSDFFETEALSDTETMIVSYYGKDSAVVIPSEIDGRVVSVIGAEAFLGNTIITSVTIPSTVWLIETNAFYGCDSISEVYFEGTTAEGDAIEIEEGNEALKNAYWSYGASDGAAACDHKYQVIAMSASSCTEASVKTYRCVLCGDSYEEVVAPARGHNFEEIKTDDGTVVIQCTYCGATEGDEAHSHSYDISTVVTEATCSDEGLIMYTCSGCGESYNEAIPAIGHNYEYFADKDINMCTNCGAVKSTIGEEPHEHNYEEKRVEPTCETEGIVTYSCLECGAYYSETLPMLGHNYDYITVDGATIYACTYCGELGESGGGDVHVHSYEEIRREPTCESDGLVTYYCSECGERNTETIPALGHNFEEIKTAEGVVIIQCTNCGKEGSGGENEEHTHSYDARRGEDPTCTDDGFIEYYCEGCGDTYIEDLPAFGHDYEYFEDKKVYVCSNCGDSYTEEEPGVDPEPGDGEHTHSYDARRGEDPTCTEDGFVEYYCEGCGDTYIESVPALGHSFDESEYENGILTYICSNCGETKTEELDPDAPVITIESVSTTGGKQVEVKVSITNNPGFSFLSLTAKYPSELTLVKVKNGSLVSGLTSGKNLVWAPDEEAREDGVLMTLVFEVSDSVEAGDYDIELNFNESYNSLEEDVNFEVIGGTLTVLDFEYGDANGDGEIDGKDVVRLTNYFANYDYETETSTVEIFGGADANGDGEVTGKDVVRLKNYLAEYDYETGSSSVVLGPQG